MGGDRVTVENLEVLKVIPENNLLLVKGSVPRSKGSYVLFRSNGVKCTKHCRTGNRQKDRCWMTLFFWNSAYEHAIT